MTEQRICAGGAGVVIHPVSFYSDVETCSTATAQYLIKRVADKTVAVV